MSCYSTDSNKLKATVLDTGGGGPIEKFVVESGIYITSEEQMLSIEIRSQDGLAEL